jgi:hypothetical protein
LTGINPTHRASIDAIDGYLFYRIVKLLKGAKWQQFFICGKDQGLAT